jgi:hypothetical protein
MEAAAPVTDLMHLSARLGVNLTRGWLILTELLELQEQPSFGKDYMTN